MATRVRQTCCVRSLVLQFCWTFCSDSTGLFGVLLPPGCRAPPRTPAFCVLRGLRREFLSHRAVRCLPGTFACLLYCACYFALLSCWFLPPLVPLPCCFFAAPSRPSFSASLLPPPFLPHRFRLPSPPCCIKPLPALRLHAADCCAFGSLFLYVLLVCGFSIPSFTL